MLIMTSLSPVANISTPKTPVKSQSPATWISLPVDVVSRIRSFCSQDSSTPPLSLICKNWQSYLHWSQRPLEVQKSIGRAFARISSDTSSKWGWYNGNKKYRIHEIDDHALAKVLIQQLPVTQTTATFLDVGAGNFQWGASLATFLNLQQDIREDLQITIVNVRGEKLPKKRW